MIVLLIVGLGLLGVSNAEADEIRGKCVMYCGSDSRSLREQTVNTPPSEVEGDETTAQTERQARRARVKRWKRAVDQANALTREARKLLEQGDRAVSRSTGKDVALYSKAARLFDRAADVLYDDTSYEDDTWSREPESRLTWSAHRRTMGHQAQWLATYNWIVSKEANLVKHAERAIKSSSSAYVPSPPPWRRDVVGNAFDLPISGEMDDRLLRDLDYMDTLGLHISGMEALWRVLAEVGAGVFGRDEARRKGWRRFVEVEQSLVERQANVGTYWAEMIQALGTGTFNARELERFEQIHRSNWCEFVDVVFDRDRLVSATPPALRSYVPGACR